MPEIRRLPIGQSVLLAFWATTLNVATKVRSGLASGQKNDNTHLSSTTEFISYVAIRSILM